MEIRGEEEERCKDERDEGRFGHEAGVAEEKWAAGETEEKREGDHPHVSRVARDEEGGEGERGDEGEAIKIASEGDGIEAGDPAGGEHDRIERREDEEVGLGAVGEDEGEAVTGDDVACGVEVGDGVSGDVDAEGGGVER